MRLHLIDGTFELFRAHYSKRPEHKGPAGEDLKATVGLAQSLITLLNDPAEQATHLAVAFDNPIRSFRNDLFAAYKSDEGMDPALRGQFDSAEAAVRALGVTVWSMNKFEADDALATGAERWKNEVEQVRILTPDKDLGQCLEGDRVVQVDVIRKRVLDAKALLERRGILPESIPDYLALTGDDADGIPGLAGFGEKTASALLAHFIHLEKIPLDAKLWPKGMRGADRLVETLRAQVEDALLFRKLATLIKDVPLKESLSDLEWRGAPRKELEAWCAQVKAKPEMLGRIQRWA